MDGDDLSPEQVALAVALVRKRLKTARAYMIKEPLREILSNRHLYRAEANAARPRKRRSRRASTPASSNVLA